MKIPIIVGSVMGTALQVATKCCQYLRAEGHEARLVEDFTAEDLNPENCTIALICTSNTGMGDLPANIVPFYRHLISDLPQISGRPFGIISLGDSSYPNFAQAGKTLEEAMTDLGAQRIGEHKVLDAIYVDDYEEEATQFIKEWATRLENYFHI